MKIKPVEKTGGVVVEMGPHEAQLPSGSRETTPALAAFQLKKILVPIDFSGCSEKALHYALPFAREFDAEVILLNVVEPVFIPNSELAAYPETPTMEGTKKQLELLRKELGADVRCRTVVRRGSPLNEIMDVTRELGIDLIIVSTHGRTGLERVMMGSTAERLVRHAGCPVLIVREKEHEFIAEHPSARQSCALGGEEQIEAQMTSSM